jgi:hypothetical protein
MPPVASMFAAFLGYNPIQELLGPTGELGKPGVDAQTLTGQEFFPDLLTGPFHSGLVVVFVSAAVMMFLAAVASWFIGAKYVYDEAAELAEATPLAEDLSAAIPVR